MAISVPNLGLLLPRVILDPEKRVSISLFNLGREVLPSKR
jgi:hypothetical protein